MSFWGRCQPILTMYQCANLFKNSSPTMCPDAILSHRFLIWPGSNTYVGFCSLDIDPSKFDLVHAIMAGLASSFVASSSSFWCFLLSLQGDSRHICGTKHLCLPALAKQETQAQPWPKCSVHAIIDARWKNDGFNCQGWTAKEQSSPAPQKFQVYVASLHGASLRWMSAYLLQESQSLSQNAHSAKHQAWPLDQEHVVVYHV